MKHDDERPPPTYEAAVRQPRERDLLTLSTAHPEHQAALERLEHERLMRQVDLERIAYERRVRLGGDRQIPDATNGALEQTIQSKSSTLYAPTFSQVLEAIHRVPCSSSTLKECYGQLSQDDTDLRMPPFDVALHQMCQRPDYHRPIGGLSEQATSLRDFLIRSLEREYIHIACKEDPKHQHWTDLATLVRDSRLAFRLRTLSDEKLLQMSTELQREVWRPATELGLLREEVEESILAYRKWSACGCVHAVALQNGTDTVAVKLCYDWYRARLLVEGGDRREGLLKGIRGVAGMYLPRGHSWRRMMGEGNIV